MNQSACPNARDQEARRRAAAILAQSRPAAAPPEEPMMKRYVHPIPSWNSYPWPVQPDNGAGLDRVLEELTRQNQLLVDLLGAVNALTAATLSIRSRFVGEN